MSASLMVGGVVTFWVTTLVATYAIVPSAMLVIPPLGVVSVVSFHSAQTLRRDISSSVSNQA